LESTVSDQKAAIWDRKLGLPIGKLGNHNHNFYSDFESDFQAVEVHVPTGTGLSIGLSIRFAPDTTSGIPDRNLNPNFGQEKRTGTKLRPKGRSQSQKKKTEIKKKDDLTNISTWGSINTS